jgi:hypothetical protein
LNVIGDIVAKLTFDSGSKIDFQRCGVITAVGVMGVAGVMTAVGVSVGVKVGVRVGVKVGVAVT